MQIFRCECQATLFFENVRCLSCGRALGYLPDLQTMSPIEPIEQNAAGGPSAATTWSAASADPGARIYRKCANYADENVCNWMVPSADPTPFCIACRLNETIPNLSDVTNRAYWAKIEAAKRRLVYSLIRFKLPVKSKKEDGTRGLAFAFLASRPAAEGGPPGGASKVMTGHQDGLITINIAEADEIEREQVRRQMQESYRTLLGHFRHESGHYFWDRLVRGTPYQERCRELFGDETQDYSAALKRHYEQGAPAGWQARYISVYASAHPAEDWAETWAHYLHLADTIETAHAFGVAAHVGVDDIIDRELLDASKYGPREKRGVESFARILREWVWLSLAVNSINRSMGMRDAYPFVLNESVAQKLHFVHDVIYG